LRLVGQLIVPISRHFSKPRHYSEREICDIVFPVASEHLYNIKLRLQE